MTSPFYRSAAQRLVAAGLACLLALVALAQSAAAQPNASPARVTLSDAEIAGFFDSYMRRTIKELELPGGAVVVVRDGRTILKAGYGKADLATGRSVDPERDIFRAASISKLVPWILVMQDVERGRLDLDRDIAHYLDFPIPRTYAHPITVRHLMTHSAGFADRFHGVLSSDMSAPLGEVLRANVPERVYPPGSTVAYSNYGAALAGYIVQRLDGRPWEMLVEERVLKPLDIARSTVRQPVPQDLEQYLVGTYAYGSKESADFRTTPIAPMGSLSASAGDMGRLLAMFAGGGRSAEGERVLSAASVAAMMRLQRPLAPRLDGGLGLGMLAGSYRSVRFAGHAGNMTTLATDLEVLPDYGIGWYFVFNGQGMNDIARSVRAELLMMAIDTLFSDLPAKGALAAGSSPQFTGSFASSRRQRRGPMMFNAVMDSLDVYPAANGTLVTYNSGIERRWLPAGGDLWREKETGIGMAVSRDEEGKVERVASWLIYPAAVFEPAPAYAGWVEIVLKGSIAFLLLTGLGKLVSALRRWQRLRKDDRSPRDPPVAARSSRVSRVAFRMFLVCLVGWGLFGIVIALDPINLLDAGPVLRHLMAALAIATGPLALVSLAGAFTSFVGGNERMRALLFELPRAFAAAGFAWLFYRLDFINPLANW